MAGKLKNLSSRAALEMTLPSFIIFGTRKAGTTSLYHYLEQHPQVFVSRLKGTKFFHQDPENPRARQSAPVRTLEEYSACFEDAPASAVAVGEASPTYLYDPSAAARIKQLLPEVQLIASLRNPVDRAYSEYLMRLRNNGAGVNAEPALDDLAKHTDAGLYAKHLGPYFSTFDKEQLNILVFEEWVRDLPSMLRQLYGFIGVDDGFEPDLSLKYNKGGVPKSRLVGEVLRHRRGFLRLKPYVPASVRSFFNQLRNANMTSAPALPDGFRAELAERFIEDATALSDLLGKDMVDIWGLRTTRPSGSQ